MATRRNGQLSRRTDALTTAYLALTANHPSRSTIFSWMMASPYVQTFSVFRLHVSCFCAVSLGPFERPLRYAIIAQPPVPHSPFFSTSTSKNISVRLRINVFQYFERWVFSVRTLNYHFFQSFWWWFLFSILLTMNFFTITLNDGFFQYFSWQYSILAKRLDAVKASKEFKLKLTVRFSTFFLILNFLFFCFDDLVFLLLGALVYSAGRSAILCSVVRTALFCFFSVFFSAFMRTVLCCVWRLVYCD